jgi:hypothetical protein
MRLDRLTQEEARMATTQLLKATRGVDDRVAGVDGRVKAIDGKVTKIVDGTRTTFSQLPKKRLILTHPDGNKAKVVMQQTADNIDQAKRSSTSYLIVSDAGASSILAGSQLRENLRKWLSPPDSSTNHNIACAAHLKGTITWFLQGSTFQKWKSSGSLLWMHGKRMFLNCYPYRTP